MDESTFKVVTTKSFTFLLNSSRPWLDPRSEALRSTNARSFLYKVIFSSLKFDMCNICFRLRSFAFVCFRLCSYGTDVVGGG